MAPMELWGDQHEGGGGSPGDDTLPPFRLAASDVRGGIDSDGYHRTPMVRFRPLSGFISSLRRSVRRAGKDKRYISLHENHVR